MTFSPTTEGQEAIDAEEPSLQPIAGEPREHEVPAALTLFALGMVLVSAASPGEELDPTFASWAVAAGLTLLAVATTVLELFERRVRPDRLE